MRQRCILAAVTIAVLVLAVNLLSAAAPKPDLLKIRDWDLQVTFHGRDRNTTADHDASVDMTATMTLVLMRIPGRQPGYAEWDGHKNANGSLKYVGYYHDIDTPRNSFTLEGTGGLGDGGASLEISTKQGHWAGTNIATPGYRIAMTTYYPGLMQRPPGMPIGLALVPTVDAKDLESGFVYGPLPASGTTISGTMVRRGYLLPPFGMRDTPATSLGVQWVIKPSVELAPLH